MVCEWFHAGRWTETLAKHDNSYKIVYDYTYLKSIRNFCEGI
jgi:hypothetical protein